MARQVPWLRILAEGAAIVVSILLAFAIQAWWELRNDRQEVNATLVALRDELLVVQEGIENHSFQMRRGDSTAVVILQRMSENNEDSAQLDSLFIRFGPFVAYFPPTAAATDATTQATSSDGIDGDLRRALIAYLSQLDDFRTAQQFASDAYTDRYAPLLNEYVNMRDQAEFSRSPFPYPVNPPVPFESDYGDLFRDRRFANSIVGRRLSGRRVWQQEQDLLRTIQDLMVLLDDVEGPQ